MDGAADGDDILDVFLDARLRGEATDVAAFCALHDVTPTTRARLEAIAAAAPASSAPAAADGRLPERLGDFRVVRPLDAGGMGSVVLAVQESLGREVALKVIRPEMRDSPEAQKRFRREALALARLRHPNIVSVIAVGEERGVRFLAMELAPGRTLDDVLADAASRGESVAWRRAFGWARDLARALQCAHDAGIVHRDVKPSNVRITPDDRPLLLDFGIARDAREEAGLTQTFAGSPLYAAPEQLSGAALDGRADVYGLGATLYQCITGRVPIPGGTMEDVLRRVLAEDPTPPRRLVPALPRDAEIVVLTALAKEPERRYATAAAFADDLDAVLSSRPIRARPTGVGARFVKWCRRRPAAAAALATVAAALIAAAVLVAANERAAAADRRRRVDETLADARSRLDDYRRRREETHETEQRTAWLREHHSFRHLSKEEDREMETGETAVADFRREREVRLQEVIELLRFAERLDPDASAAADEVRAALYRERWLEARSAHDVPSREFFRGRVTAYDRAGRYAEELRGVSRLAIAADPPDATVHLLRLREQAEVVPGGERRLVPTPPEGVEWPVPPGTWVLRVVDGADALREGDLIVRVAGRPVQGIVLATGDAGDVRRLDRLQSIDGAPVACVGDVQLATRDATVAERVFVFERDGRTFEVRGKSPAAPGVVLGDAAACAEQGDVEVEAWTDGALRAMKLPRGLRLRTTAAPVFLSERTVVGRAPLALEREEGQWLAVAEGPGRRRAIRTAELRLEVRELPLFLGTRAPDEIPDGYVAVSGDSPEACFALMEREVQAGEYLEFLNLPETLARIDASKTPILFPRSPQNRNEGGTWPRGGDGRYALPDWCAPDWPVLGVSWDDARAYAAWITARAAAAGRPWETYGLPTQDEWSLASGRPGRDYVFGNRFSRRWVSCCFSRAIALPEPTMSRPVNESPSGAYDMAGSAGEWLDHWYDQSRNLRFLAGGSWAQTDERLFCVLGGVGGRESASHDETGFRLVMRGRRPR